MANLNADNEIKLIGDILAEDEEDNEALFNSLKLDATDIEQLSHRAHTAPPIGLFTPISNNDFPQEDQYSYLGYQNFTNDPNIYSATSQNDSEKISNVKDSKPGHNFNIKAEEFVPSKPITPQPQIYYSPQVSLSNSYAMANPMMQQHYISPQIMPQMPVQTMQGMNQPGMPEYSPWAQYYANPGYMEGELGIPTRPPDLTELKGQIVEASKDQHGSRIIQYRFETASLAEKKIVFEEVIPKCLQLMNDVFGNYVVQKLLEFGTEEMKRTICEQLVGNVVLMGKEIYGCRVVQKALEVASGEMKNLLVKEIRGKVLELVEDQNGNHVIQKCVEHLASENLQFVVGVFKYKTLNYALHPFGCRVLQRMLEHLPAQMLTDLMSEVIPSTHTLSQDQFGNYVIQHLLEHGTTEQKTHIIGYIRGHVMILSTHKYASNVLERCLMFGTMEQRNILIEEMLQPVPESFDEFPLLTLMKDRYGNYVVQRAIKQSSGRLKNHLVEKIKEHETTLRNFTYGKHIMSCLEKMKS